MFHKKLYLAILIVSLSTLLTGFLSMIPPVPNSFRSSDLISLKWNTDKPSYARCTHHAGLNPSSAALRTVARWQTEELYDNIRQRFINESGFDPNLARQDPAWSDYDLLHRHPLTIRYLGFEIMNATTLNYSYVDRNNVEVVTSRTLVVCSNSSLVKMAGNRIQFLPRPISADD